MACILFNPVFPNNAAQCPNTMVSFQCCLVGQANQVYSSVTGVSTLGTGAQFTVYRDGAGGISTVTITNFGGAYGVGTTVSIAGTSIGGSTPSNNLTLTVSELRNDNIVLTVTESAARVQAVEVDDWYDQQTLDLTNTTLYWKTIAPKPRTNNYVLERSGKNDAMHIVLVDDTGDVTGIKGNILEKHISVSKATDTISSVNSPQKIWYKNYLANYSKYIYAGDNPSETPDFFHNTTPTVTGFTNDFSTLDPADGVWDQAICQSVQRIVFRTHPVVRGSPRGRTHCARALPRHRW